MNIMLMVAAVMAPLMAHAEPLNLLCQGTAVHTEASDSYGAVWTNDGASASADTTEYHRARSNEAMRVLLDGSGGGKLRLPVALIPPISRGKNGWWDFTSLAVTDDAIRGQISLNLINHPTVVIDRHSGDFDLKGLHMRFSGTCERQAAPSEDKKF